ncbi:hypothetical protein QQF64_036405 [Cirrhinus molitorella]|uniref:Uncharacterized protein n=1 Tax=Cirrhinus molitorella TaxID=172907 RepID=A0ABR3NIE7_9TELE
MFPPLQIYGLLIIKVFWALLYTGSTLPVCIAKKLQLPADDFRRHTYDAIAAEIEQIHSSFALCGKITSTVTDNDANFVKAFRMFQVDEDDAAEHNEDEIVFTDLHDVLREDSKTNERLSRHGLTPSLLAAVTLPKFKLRWLRDETRKDTIKMTLAAPASLLHHELPQKEPLQSLK